VTQKRHAATRSFDHLVGANKQHLRNREAEGLGSFEIDDQVEIARLYYRKIRWPAAFENLSGANTDLTISVRNARAVAQQAAGFGKLTREISCGYCMVCC
jgi:hypothetical protein